jgi:hypothetical protein
MKQAVALLFGGMLLAAGTSVHALEANRSDPPEQPPDQSASGTVDVPIDQLSDLTSRVSVIVTLKGRDNFTNEFRYDVTVRNQSTDPVVARSLILVLEQITDLAGKEAMPRMEVIGEDGLTPEGKPYFRVPQRQGRVLPPYSESAPATVRLRNPAYTIVFTPSFRVFGLPLRKADASDSLTALIRLLIQKGLLTEQEWREATQASPSP